MYPSTTTITNTPGRANPTVLPTRAQGTRLHLKFQSPLTPTEEVALTSRAAFDIPARQQLITHYLGLVADIVSHYANYGKELGELEGCGNLGLTEAAAQFDYRTGKPFLFYAADRVRKAIYAFFGFDGSSPRLPAALRTELRKLDEVENTLYQKLEHRPTNAEIAPYLASTPAKVGELRLLKVKLDSLNRKARVASESESSELIEMIAAPVVERVCEAEDEVNRAEVDILLERDIITAEEKQALIHAYGLQGNPDRTYREVGELMGCSHTTVGNRIAAAIRKLAVIPRLRPTWVKPKPTYEAGVVQPVIRLGTCAECGKIVTGWGNVVFRDWQQYRQSAQDTPASTVPELMVCYRCSLTPAFAARCVANAAARREMLKSSSAIHLMVWDYLKGKLVSVVSYAPTVVRKPLQHQPNPRCCYCKAEVTDDNLGDVVATAVEAGRYHLTACCRPCYQRIKVKWDAAKRERGLLSLPQPEVVAVTPTMKKRTPNQPDRLTRLYRHWMREAKKLAVPQQPLPLMPALDDWRYGSRGNPTLDLGTASYTADTRLPLAIRREQRKAEAERIIAQLPGVVRSGIYAERRLEAARADQARLYRELLRDEELAVTACIELATSGSHQGQILAYRFLEAASEVWRTADWQPRPQPQPTSFGLGTRSEPVSRAAKCQRCHNLAALLRLNLGRRSGRDGISYDYAVGLCTTCYPQVTAPHPVANASAAG